MWCSNCGAYVAGGEACDRCGASLPRQQVAQPPAWDRQSPPVRRPASAKKAAKRGTLGDFARGAKPPVRPDAPAAPKRSWRPRKSQPQAGPIAPVPPAQPWAPPAQPWAPPRPDARRVPPPAMPPATPPMGEGLPLNSASPWDADLYGAAGPAPLSPGTPSIMPPTAGPAPWGGDTGLGANDSGWRVVNPTGAPPPAPIPGSQSAWRNHRPLRPLNENGALRVPQGGSPPRARSRGRQVISGVTNGVFNTLMILLIVGIIGISVAVGAQRLSGSQVQATPPPAKSLRVPTPTLASGYVGFDDGLYTVAYPTGWTRTSNDELVLVGTSLTSFHRNLFVYQHQSDFAISTVLAIPADELQQLVDNIAKQTYQNETLQPVASNLSPTYGGAQWLESDYIITQVRGGAAVELEMRVLAVNHNATTYVILLASAANGFDATNAKTFEPILASFRFQ